VTGIEVNRSQADERNSKPEGNSFPRLGIVYPIIRKEKEERRRWNGLTRDHLGLAFRAGVHESGVSIIIAPSERLASGTRAVSLLFAYDKHGIIIERRE